MPLIERYIFRTALTAFLVGLVALTGVIWITSALRELDLVSAKGQTILVFLTVTLLGLPALVMIVAPFALFVAILHTLNKLNSDSELIVMSAAGIAPWRVARPFVVLTLLVSLLIGWITLYAMPASFRTLRDLITQIRADVVTKIVQEGRFITLDRGITFHFREKGPSGTMLGVLVADRRDPAKPTTFLAERGQIVDASGSSYMVLEKGSVHRKEGGSADNAIVAFEQYAIDLDQFGADGGKVFYKPRERTTGELLSLDLTDKDVQTFYGRFRAELHERLVNPLYPLATLAIAFAALGSARTTRQGRGLALLGAVLAIVALRIAGFGASSLAVRTAAAVPLMYAVPLVTILIGILLVARDAGVSLGRRASRASPAVGGLRTAGP